MKLNKDQIIAINDMIEKAIDHGGDYGGPYYCYIDNLMVSLNRFIETLEIENVEIIECRCPYLEITKGE